MVKNYLKIAFRNLFKNKIYSFINIFGLAVGMAATILLALWVQDELSYDGFHKNAQQIYRVISHMDKSIWGSTPAPVATFALQQVPEVENAVRVTNNYNNYLYKYQEKTFTEKNGAFVDPSFFTLFNFPLVKGDIKKPFANNHSLVITEKTAQKYFGLDNPIGKIIQIDGKENYMVTGIIANIPDNSLFKYNFFFPFDILKGDYNGNSYWKSLDSDWGNYNYDTYVSLKPQASAKVVGEKITKIHQDNQKEYKEGAFFHSLQPLLKIHLYKTDGSESGMQVVRIFIIVGLVILLIACINYVNLATARATQRGKEVGVRKIIGANQSQLFGQFVGESTIVFGLALALAVVIILFVKPYYNDISGKELVFSLSNPTVLTVLGSTFIITLLSAGLYPALLLSSFEPLQAIRGKFSIGSSNISFRKTLVTLQFCFSIVLIISTLVIRNQLTFIRNKNLGFDKENVFVFGMREINNHYEAVKQEMLQLPDVKDVSAAGSGILQIGSSTTDTDWDGKEPKRVFVINQISTERNFLKTMNLTLVAGEGYTNTPADSGHYILNETAIKQMGMKDPIGKRFKFHDKDGTIVGIVKDFHFQSIHSKIEPFILYWNPGWRSQMYVKTTGQNTANVITAAEKIWKKYNTAYPFEYRFLNDEYDKMYKSDQQVGVLFNVFAGIAILISCLGLFGLATFTAETRTKEIGIRKVLGASVLSIVTMLSKDFTKLILFAALIAFPLAWWAMSNFLQGYAYQIEIGWAVFLVAGVLALLIALLTISYQAIRAALMNPVKSLKNE